MIYVVFLAGIVVGSVIANILYWRRSAIGVLMVDKKRDLCEIRLSSKEISLEKKKRVVLTIDHDADISQD